MKIKEVTFVNRKLEEDYLALKDGKFEDRELFRFLTRAKEDVLKDPLCGIRVPARLIPQVYLQRYNVISLWKYDLPNGWRMLYTILGNEVKIVGVILEWMSHKDYERRFGY